MKKLFIFVLSAMLLSGCGGTKAEETTTAEETTVEETEVETTKEETTEYVYEEPNVIRRQEYEVRNGNFKISIAEDKEKNVSLTFGHTTEDPVEAAYVFLQLALLCSAESMEAFSPSILVSCDDVILTPAFSMDTSGGETKILNATDWCTEQFKGANVDETFFEEIDAGMDNAINDFFGLESKADESVHLYTDENVSIWYTGMIGDDSEYDINFIIENCSEETITIQVRETSINGFMVDPMCSIDIAPGKKAKDGMIIWGDDAEDNPIDEVKNIETKFRIIFDDYEKSYETENIVVMDIE